MLFYCCCLPTYLQMSKGSCAHGASWPLASAELALAGYILLCDNLIFVHFALTVRRF